MSYCSLKGRLRQSTPLSGQLGQGPKLKAKMDIHLYGETGGIYSPDITIIRVLDRAEYEALPEKDSATLYFLKG